MVILVELLHTTHIDLILELSNAEVLDLNRIGDCPLKTNRDRRQVVGVLDQLELSATVEGLALKPDSKRLAIQDLEEDAQMVLANFLWIVEHMEIHLLTRSQRASARFNLKDLLVEDLLLKGLLLARSARVSPRLHLDL